MTLAYELQLHFYKIHSFSHFFNSFFNLSGLYNDFIKFPMSLIIRNGSDVNGCDIISNENAFNFSSILNFQFIHNKTFHKKSGSVKMALSTVLFFILNFIILITLINNKF